MFANGTTSQREDEDIIMICKMRLSKRIYEMGDICFFEKRLYKWLDLSNASLIGYRMKNACWSRFARFCCSWCLCLHFGASSPFCTCTLGRRPPSLHRYLIPTPWDLCCQDDPRQRTAASDPCMLDASQRTANGGEEPRGVRGAARGSGDERRLLEMPW